METEITQVDPTEFNLDQKTAKSIESHFMPAIVERNALEEVYKNLITGELTEELSVQAGELRRRLVKVRTSMSAIHKTEKAFYRAGGLFVDAWKNKNTEPITQMEDKLKEIEKHWENEERKKIEKIQDERIAEIEKYLDDSRLIPHNLGTMEDSVWENYYAGSKAQFEARKAEKKQLEEERIEKERFNELYQEREKLMAPLQDFLPKGGIKWTSYDEDQFNRVYATAKQDKKEHETEQEKIRLDNIRLQKEAKEKEELAEIEKAVLKKQALLAQAKERKNEKRQRELLDMDLRYDGDSFIYEDVNFHHTDIICMSDEEWNKQIKGAKNRMAEIKAEKEKERLAQEAKIQRQKEIAAIKLEKEIEKRKKFENKLLEAKEAARRQGLLAKKALAAPDKVKLELLANDLATLSFPELKTEEANDLAILVKANLKEIVFNLKIGIKKL